jgi:hypothetical protein
MQASNPKTKMTECVILVGLPASGKTTFYQRNFASSHIHISKDNWPNAPRKGVRQARMIAEALSQGRSIVVDNTNPTIDDRRAIIDVAHAHGARIVGYYFDASTATRLDAIVGGANRSAFPTSRFSPSQNEWRRRSSKKGSTSCSTSPLRKAATSTSDRRVTSTYNRPRRLA